MSDDSPESEKPSVDPEKVASSEEQPDSQPEPQPEPALDEATADAPTVPAETSDEPSVAAPTGSPLTSSKGRGRIIALSAVVAVIVIAAAVFGGVKLFGGNSKPDLSTLTAAKLLTKAKAAVVAQTDIQINGSGSDSGSTVGLNIDYVGNDASGAITLGPAAIQLLTVGDSAWFKASDDFWKSQFAAKKAAQIISVVAGRWIKVDPTDANFKDIFTLAHRTGLGTGLLDPTGAVTKGTPKTVNGVPCLALKSSSGILYVDRTDGRPIEIVDSTGTSSKLTFGYAKQAAPKAPAASDVLDYSALSGAGQ